MGVFADHQPIYASHNIPTFPVQGKKPAVKGFARFGLKTSGQLAFKFPDIDALAFMAGGRSRITSLDIDSSDEDLLRDMMKRHGQTSIIVRSGSGNFQAWYLFNGEKRLIRPYGASVPVDVLGRVDKRGSPGAVIVIQAGICNGDQRGTRPDVERRVGVL